MPDDIIGLDVLEARLNALSKKLTKEEFEKSAKRGMIVYVEGPAKRKSAIDGGRLRNSITTTIDQDKVITGTNVEYGPYVEFGTGIYAEDGQGRKTPWVYLYDGKKGDAGFRLTVGNHPQPFMRPAWDEGKKDVVQSMEDDAEAAVKEAISV
ncbi:MAG: HK97-gp10 family putative phage morphogenesis protein [Sphaerochaetaceae bacterium]